MKSILYLLLCCLSISAWANQANTLPTPNNTNTPNYYLEANIGASIQSWNTQNLATTMSSTTPLTAFSHTPADQHLTYGFNAGWTFADQFALELGWYQQSTAQINSTTSLNIKGNLHSWLSYLACRLTMFTNMNHYFNLFAKVGISYNNNQFTWSGATQGEKDNNFIDAIIGLGGSIDLSSRFYIGAQALYMLKNNQHFEVPANTLVVATAGLKF